MTEAAQRTAAAVDEYGALVMKVAWRVLPQADEAADIFQTTFLAYHSAMANGEEIIHPKAWLCRTALNAACKRQRQRRREVLLDEGVAGDLGDCGKDQEQAALLGRVRQMVAELPDRQREVFILRNYEGWSFAEIGAALGCTEESARANEYKALKKLRAWLGDDWRG